MGCHGKRPSGRLAEGDRRDADGHLADEVTVWDTVATLTRRRYAYRTVTDPAVDVVNLDTTDFAAPARTRELSWTGGLYADHPLTTRRPAAGAVTADAMDIVVLDGNDFGRGDPVPG